MDYIVIAIIILILGCAIAYIVKAKKSGVKCIGCVHSKTCGGKCSSQSEIPEFIQTNVSFQMDSCEGIRDLNSNFDK